MRFRLVVVVALRHVALYSCSCSCSLSSPSSSSFSPFHPPFPVPVPRFIGPRPSRRGVHPDPLHLHPFRPVDVDYCPVPGLGVHKPGLPQKRQRLLDTEEVREGAVRANVQARAEPRTLAPFVRAKLGHVELAVVPEAEEASRPQAAEDRPERLQVVARVEGREHEGEERGVHAPAGRNLLWNAEEAVEVFFVSGPLAVAGCSG
jgi:hypothetical protein